VLVFIVNMWERIQELSWLRMSNRLTFYELDIAVYDFVVGINWETSIEISVIILITA